MTWSLKLTSDGDLALGGASLGKVANEEKLIQDLKYEFLEKKGSDPLNPDYGSNLDNQIGSNFTSSYANDIYQVSELNIKIESDVADVIRRYQQRQLARAKSDKMIRGAATLTPKEAVVNFQINEIVQNQTSVNVKIDITTASASPNGYPVQLSLTI